MDTPVSRSLYTGAALTAKRFVIYDRSDGDVIPVPAAGASKLGADTPIGVAPIAYPDINMLCDIYIAGPVKVQAGESIPPFSPITPGPNGEAFVARPGDLIVGFAMTEGADAQAGPPSSVPETVADGADVTVDLIGVPVLQLPGGLVGLQFFFDFGADGSPHASDLSMRGAYGQIVKLPGGAIVKKSYYFVETAFLPNDATTVGIFGASSAAGDPDIVAAVAINDAGNPWDAGGHDGIQDGAGANMDAVGSATAIPVVIRASGAITAGKLTGIVEFLRP